MRNSKPTTWKGFGVYAGILLAVLVLVAVTLDRIVLPLIVAASPTLNVPDVEGRTIQDAIEILQGRGLQVMPTHEQYSNDVPTGIVINQMPYSGATVKQGRRIYLTVSKGVETATMPDLHGRSIREARLTMLRLGMQLGNVTYEHNDSVPAESILYQSIKPGSKVTSDLTPSVVVCQGPSAIMVPAIVGLKLFEARTLLEQSSLQLSVSKKQKSNTFESDVVLFQYPQADSLVQPGTVISVTVTE